MSRARSTPRLVTLTVKLMMQRLETLGRAGARGRTTVAILEVLTKT